MSAAAQPPAVTDPDAAVPDEKSLAALRDPAPERARSAAAAALDGDAMLTLHGRCTVDYEGRASSTLGPGDRLVVCKPDGTVLVHTDEGREPVNWQPPDSEQAVSLVESDLELHSERTSPDETLTVRFARIDHLVAYRAVDEEELSLSGTEADLRERLLAAPDLVESGFEPRATERDTAAGAVDLYGEDADGRPVAVELKRRRVGPDAVGQLNRYVDALDRELHADAEVRGVLVAPSVTDRARELLAERGLEFVSLEPDPDGDAA
jgi:RecB family endonuclease NucS